MKFFHLRKVEAIVAQIQMNKQRLDLDLMKIPNIFELLKEYKMIFYQQQTEISPALPNIERDEFVHIITQHIKNSRYIENLNIRVNLNNTPEKEELQFFTFNPDELLVILKLIKENSHICMLKNFEISSELHPDKRNK